MLARALGNVNPSDPRSTAATTGPLPRGNRDLAAAGESADLPTLSVIGPRREAPEPSPAGGDGDEGSSRDQVRRTAGRAGPSDSRARARAGAGPDGGLRPVPHRHP